jgi:UDP-N-acetyl-2-amino-2-deoxyglucuronate dehydrogenase
VKDKIGYGIIGCGHIAPKHAESLLGIPNVELIALSNRNTEKAEQIKAKYGGRYIYSDYHDLLARDDIDIVSICTPSGTHAEIGIDAAKAGKSIMVEKPIEITLERIDRLIQAAKEHNVKLSCIFQRRAIEMWQYIHRVINEGRLGKMVLGSIYVKYNRTQEYYDSAAWRGTWALDGGGALMNQGIHIVDLLRWIMGPADRVFGFADHLVRDIEVEDTAVASIRFKSGAFGTIEGTTSLTPGMNHRLEFHGEHGSICVKGEGIVTWNVPGDDPETIIAQLNTSSYDISSNPLAVSIEGHRAQIADLVEAVRENREPKLTGEEGRKSVELILAVYKSAQTGQPVCL